MRVLVKEGGLLEAGLVAHLQELGLSASFAGLSVILDNIEAYCTTGALTASSSSSSDELLCVVVSAEDAGAVEALAQLLQLPAVVRRPRVVLLSTLLTWGGRSYGDAAIVDYRASFASRIPASSAVPAFFCENLVHNLASVLPPGTIEVAVVGVGLLYGGAGWDLESLLHDMWEANGGGEIKIRSVKGGSNRVPMLHYRDLFRAVSELLQSASLPAFSFLPMTDGGRQTLDDLFVGINRSINGSSATVVYPTTEQEYVEELLLSADASAKALLWNLDLSFSQTELSRIVSPSASVLSGSFESVWREYLDHHALKAVSVAVAGNPKSGKTELASAVASILKAEHVTSVKAVGHVLKTSIAEGDAGPISALQSEIMSIVESKQAEGKKPPKKGEEVAPTPLDPSSVEVNEALCSSFSPEILRRCISTMVQTHPSCVRKGYVLDAWDSSSVASADDVCEMITGVRRAVISDEGNPDEVQALPGVPELLIELQCADAVIVQRYLVSLGVPEGGLAKSSKENQAAVKVLEAALSTYAAAVRPIPPLEGGEDAAGASASHSHGVVLDILGSPGGDEACYVARFDTQENGQLESISLQVCQRLCKLRGGRIGWLPDLEAPPEAAFAVDSSPPEVVIVGGQLGQLADSGVEKPDVERSLQRVNESISSLSIESRTALIGQCDELQEYLLANVMPCLVQGMVEVGKGKIEDPILYISQFLQREGQRLEDAAEAEALEAFNRILADALAVEKRMAQITGTA